MESRALLSFEAGSEASHLPSAIIRWFKDSRKPVSDKQALQALCQTLAEVIFAQTANWRITHICRVLSSWETKPIDTTPMHLLMQDTAERLGATVITPFRRTTIRPPMSTQKHLSGSGTLSLRIRFAAQDLIFEGDFDGARVLVLDDIRCMGASEAVWRWALQALGGADWVGGLHLAQESTLCGNFVVMDIDTEELRQAASGRMGARNIFFQRGWLSASDKLLHFNRNCADIQSCSSEWWLGLTSSDGKLCSRCSQSEIHGLRRLLGRLLGR